MIKTIFSIIILVTICFANPKNTGPAKVKHVEAELISEVYTIQSAQPFWVALRLKIEPHWHVMWRNAGDAGFPVSINWQLPEGFVAGEIQWPYPEKFTLDEFANFGYAGEVSLLVMITPSDNLKAGDTIVLKAQVDWLTCKETCVPENAQLNLSLLVSEDSPKINDKEISLFSKTQSRLPLKNSEWQIATAIIDTTLIINATPPAWMTDDISQIHFYPYIENIIQNASPQPLKKIESGYQISVALSPDIEEIPVEISGILVSNIGWRGTGSEKALEFNTKILEEIPVTSSSAGKIWMALLFAFLGGMILNLMPCVLPVLSLKILGFVEQAGQDKKKSMQHGFAFTLGVLVSFWILAGLLLLLRAGGEQLGWGFQLQSPTFVIILSIFMFLFGLSLFGVFDIGTKLTTVGHSVSNKSGHFGSFMSGIMATIVATPCTAPFMGSALGFALSQPAFVSMLIFTSLGLGMAVPYVILASIPALLRFVPKPGPWMETLSQVMGFLLIATVIWLIWVLSIQTGADGVIILLISLLIASLGAWIFGNWGNITKKKLTRTVAQILAGLSIIGGIAFSLTNIDASAATGKNQLTASQGSIHWKEYSPELIKELRSHGKPVFIDFTAAWCLSCQVNHKVAFGSAEVQEEFTKLGITAVLADWTSRDESITKALASFGRNSVPLYVLYGPDSESEPIILPEVITPGIVLDALKNIY